MTRRLLENLLECHFHMNDMPLTEVLATTDSERAGACLGPHTVTLLRESQHLSERAARKYSTATVYFPGTTPPSELLASVVLVPGWACGENVMSSWAHFLASHGFVALTIGTLNPFYDMPSRRAAALMDAVGALKEEHTRRGSALQGRLDLDRFAVAGWSMGGGACQLVALADPTLRCVIAMTPHPGALLCKSLPEKLTESVPSLFVVGQCDPVAWPCLAHRMYRAVTAPKMFFEVRRGGHAAACGPAGGSLFEIPFGYGVCAACTFTAGMVCGSCSPLGAFDRPTGRAREVSKYGSIGGVVLKWLRLHLQGDAADATPAAREELAEQLRVRPSIASTFIACDNALMTRT